MLAATSSLARSGIRAMAASGSPSSRFRVLGAYFFSKFGGAFLGGGLFFVENIGQQNKACLFFTHAQNSVFIELLSTRLNTGIFEITRAIIIYAQGLLGVFGIYQFLKDSIGGCFSVRIGKCRKHGIPLISHNERSQPKKIPQITG